MTKVILIKLQSLDFRLLSLASQSKRFKVETNAKQLHMTGCVLLFKNVNLVIVEGGPKQQSKFKKLMLSRIKWAEDTVSKDGTDQGEKVGMGISSTLHT